MKILVRKAHLQNKKRTEKLTEKGASHEKSIKQICTYIVIFEI